MYNFDLGRPASVYFCGIGGVSMSGLALILKSRGFRVSGSDRAKSAVTENLEAQGIHVFYGQKKENITPDIDLMVFTAAIHPDNPEFVAAEAYGIPMMTRAELLGLIMKDYELPVAVSGTHGKTTTTSMLSEILLAQDTDPTLSVGGNLRSIGGNVRIGGPKYFVAEACEYTNSFLSMFPKYGIILDIDADHLDFFKDLDDIRRSFRKFAELLPADGALIIHSDIERLGEITEGLSCRVFTYGNSADDDYQVRSLTFDDHGHPSFVFHIKKSGKDVPVALSVPGEHNAFNACAALAAADLLGMDAAASAEAVGNYHGADRRFEILGEKDGVLIVDLDSKELADKGYVTKGRGRCEITDRGIDWLTKVVQDRDEIPLVSTVADRERILTSGSNLCYSTYGDVFDYDSILAETRSTKDIMGDMRAAQASIDSLSEQIADILNSIEKKG